jgi:hypothetical protein
MCSISLSKDKMFCWNDFPIRSSENVVLPSGLYLYSVICRPVAGQRLGKHIPAATNTQAKIG